MSLVKNLLLAATILAVAFAYSAFAHAQSAQQPTSKPPEAQTDEAKQGELAQTLFDSGREALSAGDLARACPLFERSYRLDQASGTLLNLAACREHQERLVEAATHYREFLRSVEEDDPRRPPVTERLQSLETRLPHLVIVLPEGMPQDASFWRNGERIPQDQLQDRIPVNVGRHLLNYRVGDQEERREILLVEGQVYRWEPQLKIDQPKEEPAAKQAKRPLTEPALSANHKTSRTRSFRRSTSLVLLGIGAAGLIAGTVLGIVALSNKGIVDDECEDNQCSQRGLDAHARGKTFAEGSTIAFVAGGVVLGSGALLFFTSPTAPSRPDPQSGFQRSTSVGAHLQLAW